MTSLEAESDSGHPPLPNSVVVNHKATGKTGRLALLRFFGLLIADHVIAITIVAPLVAGCWRGTWIICDLYFFPHAIGHSVVVSAALGSVILLAACLLQGRLMKLDGQWRDNRLWWFLGNHCYTYVMLFGCVNVWRGPWIAFDHYTGTGIRSNVITAFIGTVGLYLLRSMKNASSAPIVVVMDTDRSFFSFATRFGTQPKDGENHMLDVLLSVLGLNLLVTAMWRGVWGVIDRLLFPGDPLQSAWASIVLAAAAMALCTLMEITLLCLQKKLRDKTYVCIVIESVAFALANVTAIGQWRGVWMLCDIFIYPSEPLYRAWLLHAVGFALLVLGLCSNSLLLKGVELDGDTLPQAFDALYPNKYIRYFLEARQGEDESKVPHDNGTTEALRGHEDVGLESIVDGSDPEEDQMNVSKDIHV